MTEYAFAKRFEGYFIEDGPINKPKALAELFCGMVADEQAAFFNMVRHLAAQWPNSAVFQWRGMEKHIDPDARQMLKDMYDHTDDAR